MNFDEENRKRIEAVTEELAKTMVSVVERSTRCCVNCDNFDTLNEVCNLYKARPPARIITFGCDSYEDKVPF